MIFGIDVSHYNDVPIDHDGLMANGFMFAIVKMGQGLKVDPFLRMHVKLLRRRGWLVGGYYWCDPLLPAQDQFVHTAALADEFDIRLIAPDMEQWWSNWDKWIQWRRGLISQSAVPKFSPTQLYDFFVQYTQFLDDGGLVALPYWGTGFVNSYCKPLYSFLHGRDNWVAQYPDSFARKVSWKTWFEIVPKIGKPNVPAPMTQDDILFRQYHDRITMPWMSKPVDINAFFGTEEELRQLFEG